MRDDWRWAWREARRRPGRMGWMICGYAVAVTVAAAGFAAFASARRDTQAALQVTGAQFLGFVLPGGASADDPRPLDPEHERLEAFGHPTAFLDIKAIPAIARLPRTLGVAPWLCFRMRERPDSARTLLVGGFDPTDMETVRIAGCSATEIVAGRELRREDAAGALVEQTFAEAMGLDVGSALELAGRSFAVIGVLSPGTRPAKADVYLALSDAVAVVESRFTAPLKGRVNGVLVNGRDARQQGALAAEVESILGSHGATGGFSCFAPAGQAIMLGEQGMILLALLLAGGIGLTVARLQYAYAEERRREIAILKSIGWTRRQVGRQAVLETMIPWGIGGGLGALASGIMTIREGTVGFLPGALGASLVVVGIIAACAAGLVARTSQRVLPAQVLRRG